MKKLILSTSPVLLSMLMSMKAYAADIISGDTVISEPVGKGILPGSGVEGEDIYSSIVFSKIIPFFISWGINLAIGLAVLATIYSGYLYITAYGNEDKHQRATKNLTYSVVGLVIAMTAYGIVTIITRIQFS